MKTKTHLIGAAAMLLGTTANANVLFGPAVSGLNTAFGSPASSSSKTIAIIDVDGDGIGGFNLGSWDGSSFLPDPNDLIVPGWNEATGDGDGIEALLPTPDRFSTLDVSASPYSLNIATNAGNTNAVAGGGDKVYLFFFPNLAPGAASAPLGTRFGIIDLGVLPDNNFGLLAPNLVSPNSNYRALRTVGPVPGDTDGDGDVDDADLGTSFASYTGALPPGTGNRTAAQGDTDGDGDVDDADLGTSFAGYTGALSPAVAVPEPSALAMLGFGGLVMLQRRRK